MTPDLINGLFELAGAFALSMNIFRLLRDREIRGVHWAPTVFFTAWGFWNLFYYPHLGQIWSTLGATAIVVVNSIWLLLVLIYRNPSDGRDQSPTNLAGHPDQP